MVQRLAVAPPDHVSAAVACHPLPSHWSSRVHRPRFKCSTRLYVEPVRSSGGAINPSPPTLMITTTTLVPGERGVCVLAWAARAVLFVILIYRSSCFIFVPPACIKSRVKTDDQSAGSAPFGRQLLDYHRLRCVLFLGVGSILLESSSQASRRAPDWYPSHINYVFHSQAPDNESTTSRCSPPPRHTRSGGFFSTNCAGLMAHGMRTSLVGQAVFHSSQPPG